jgi:hypothetical protein
LNLVRTPEKYFSFSLLFSLSGVTQFVHVFDGGFVDHDPAVSANLKNIAVIPFDAAFDYLAVIKHDNHGGLRLNLFLQVEKLGVPQGRLVLLAIGPQTERCDVGWSVAGAHRDAGRLDGRQRLFDVSW